METYKIPLELFDCSDYTLGVDEASLEKQIQAIMQVLNDFRVKAEVTSFTMGPSVTTFCLALGKGVTAKKIEAISANFMLSLECDSVRCYPNYATGEYCIEVPNKKRQMVPLGQMLKENCLDAKGLQIALGKDNQNRNVTGDLTKMIHTLVGGASGTGKSVWINSAIISLIYNHSPKDLKLMLFDPKKVEFCMYSGLPHLIGGEPICDFKEGLNALDWLRSEMDRRYGLFEKMSRGGNGYVINVDEYNKQVENDGEKLPKIVAVIDELADFMLCGKKEMEARLTALTQKSRAAGIYLIATTQRVAPDVISGVLKANFPTRIAFRVSTEIDSRVILDSKGAERLGGRGEFLYSSCFVTPEGRIQSPYVSMEETNRIIDYIKTNYGEEQTRVDFSGDSTGVAEASDDEIDGYYIEALKIAIAQNSASISMIQRKCGIGFNKAGKIIDWMERNGYVSPFDGAKPRKILITIEEFKKKFGE